MLSQPLKDTTVIFWNQGRSFSAWMGSKLKSAKDLPDVFFQMVSQDYWSTGTSLHPTARAHHCVTTTTLWALLGHYPFHPNADIDLLSVGQEILLATANSASSESSEAGAKAWELQSLTIMVKTLSQPSITTPLSLRCVKKFTPL